MHEISIMQDTLQLAEEHLKKAGRTSIDHIKLRVGLFSGVVPEALEFSFDVIKRGTAAEHATLEIERIPGLFLCTACGREARLDAMDFKCPACEGLLLLQEGGADLELAQMRIS